jgi:hypothetical protein
MMSDVHDNQTNAMPRATLTESSVILLRNVPFRTIEGCMIAAVVPPVW